MSTARVEFPPEHADELRVTRARQVAIMEVPLTLVRQADGNSCGTMVVLYIMHLVRHGILPTKAEYALVGSTARRLLVLNLFLMPRDKTSG